MIRYSLESRPIQIALLRKVVLIAVFATKIAKIGDVPLDVEGVFHEYP
jgi:hypothetical protein